MQQVTPQQRIAVQVVSVLINPVYGYTFSFPWKRGPLDNINEYFEAYPNFESVRLALFNQLMDFDFLSKMLVVFQSEDET